MIEFLAGVGTGIVLTLIGLAVFAPVLVRRKLSRIGFVQTTTGPLVRSRPSAPLTREEWIAAGGDPQQYMGLTIVDDLDFGDDVKIGGTE